MANLSFSKAIAMKDKLLVAVPAYVITAVMPFLAYVLCNILGKDESTFILVLAFVVLVYMMWLFIVAVFSRGAVSFAAVSSAIVTTIYISACFSSLVILRYIDKIGLFCLGMVLIGAWVSDVCAYFTGVLFGKHKLIPEVSPKKTVEGAVGAVVCTTLAMVLYGLIISVFTELVPNYLVLAVSGAVLSVTGQVGDLLASVIKREHGVKDYGTLLPGHGGIMDRFDSIIAISTILMAISMVFPPFN